MNSNFVSKVVNYYIKYKIDKFIQIKKFNNGIKNVVQEYLQSNTNSIFFWITLVCENLKKILRFKIVTIKKILEILKTYLFGFEFLYQQMMQLIYNSNDSKVFKQIFVLNVMVY